MDSDARYRQKNQLAGGRDPYEIADSEFRPVSDFGDLPQVPNMDIIIDCIFSPSPYSGQPLKAYKSLDAYKYFVAGFVRDFKVTRLCDDLYITRAKVIALCSVCV